MTWWVLTLLSNTRAWTSLFTEAHTNRADHLFMAWAKYKPSRKPVYRTVRGKIIWCGYQYVWNTPNLTEQNEPGDTIEHTFGLIPLDPVDHVWYYLFSIAGAYDQPCQGPLIHVWPPELLMPSARIEHSVPQTIPNMNTTTLTFDTVLWDDGGFYNPANPTRLTAPIRGLYLIGTCFRYATTLTAGMSAQIAVNGGPPRVYHSHFVNGNNWPGCGFSLDTPLPLEAGHYAEVETYHTTAAPRDVQADGQYGPHFWIVYLGPNPT